MPSLSRSLFYTASLGMALITMSSADQPKPTWQAGEPDITFSREDLPEGSFRIDSEGHWIIAPTGLTEQGRNRMALRQTVDLELSEGDWVVLRARARALDTAEGSEGQAGLILNLHGPLNESDEAPHPFFRHIILVGPEWEDFEIPVEIPKDLTADDWFLHLSPSYFEQPIALTPLEMHPADESAALEAPSPYPGHSPDSPWRKEARERIAEHRMGDLTIEVVDRSGKSVPGVTIRLEQLAHHYPFGTALVAGRFINAPWKFDNPEATERFPADNQRYRKEVQRLFNTVVFENDLKWPQWTGHAPHRYQQAWTLEAMDQLNRKGFNVKGHTMVWPSWRQSPSWLREFEDDPKALQQAILRHIQDVGTATGGNSTWWDVVNEPMSHRDLIELLGMEAVAEWFQSAREAMPETRLVMNEFDIVGNGGSDNRRRNFIDFVNQLQENDAPLDVVGFQGHFWSDRLTAPERMWEIMDEVHEETGLPLMISEFDMNFPNDRIQADYTADFLTAWFAHPATEAFIMWGFWGRAHWFGERGAMFLSDWTPKPNLEAYENLVLNEWWSRKDRQTDADGSVQLRVFHGTHQILLDGPDKVSIERRVKVLPDSPTSLRIVLPGTPE